MGFQAIAESALRVPGRMEEDELTFLAALARTVPKGGRMVEVGALYGRSTRALALANPDAHLTSIDTFEDVTWTQRYAAQYAEVPKFEVAAFRKYTQDLSNVSVVKGFSPDCVADWAPSIDLYFDDAVHGNPGLSDNLTFWQTHLKPGGILCGHDYTRRFPDIKSEVDRLAHMWRTKPALVGTLWAIRKPADTEQPNHPVHLEMEETLVLRVQNKKRGPYRTPAGYWCGAHLDPDRMDWIQIDAAQGEDCAPLEYRLGHPQFGQTDWVSQGHKAQLVYAGKARPFTRLAVRFKDDAHPLCVVYRVSARQIGNGGARRSGTSDWVRDGSWARLPFEGAAVNAITVTLRKTLPVDAQAEFTRTSAPDWRKVRRALGHKLLTAGRAF